MHSSSYNQIPQRQLQREFQIDENLTMSVLTFILNKAYSNKISAIIILEIVNRIVFGMNNLIFKYLLKSLTR